MNLENVNITTKGEYKIKIKNIDTGEEYSDSSTNAITPNMLVALQIFRSKYKTNPFYVDRYNTYSFYIYGPFGCTSKYIYYDKNHTIRIDDKINNESIKFNIAYENSKTVYEFTITYKDKINDSSNYHDGLHMNDSRLNYMVFSPEIDSIIRDIKNTNSYIEFEYKLTIEFPKINGVFEYNGEQYPWYATVTYLEIDDFTNYPSLKEYNNETVRNIIVSMKNDDIKNYELFYCISFEKEIPNFTGSLFAKGSYTITGVKV